MCNMVQPLVSICCITYNQQNYIHEAIEGFLMQKTTFPIEIIIHDDASTDGTAKIVKSYAEKYPDLIFPIFQTENQYSKGIRGIAVRFTFPKAMGKYIALCEGDDYWTDPYKLQKQVNFLETNEAYSMCFHNATTYFVDRDVSENFNRKLKSKSYNTNDLLLKGWFIPTASILFRKTMLPNPFPNWYYDVYNGDYGLELLLSTKGIFFYINEKMSVYRKNTINSLSINGPKGKEILKKHLLLLKNFKRSNANKNTFTNNYAIAKVRYNFLKVYIYESFPFVEFLKDKIFHRK